MRLTTMALPLLAAALAASPALADDAAVKAGMKTYKATCIYCHDNTPRHINGEGPYLSGVTGRKAGSATGYSYTPALKAAGDGGLTWDDKTLDAFLSDPGKTVPGTRMAAVVPDAKTRAQLIAYLKSLP